MATLKEARTVLKQILNYCYDEDYPELHKELISLEKTLKKNKDIISYESAIQDVIMLIPLFSDSFPEDIFYEIESLAESILDS